METPRRLPTSYLQSVLWLMFSIRWIVGTIIGFVQSRNDPTMLQAVAQVIAKYDTGKIRQLAQASLSIKNDITALKRFIIPVIQKSIIGRYYPVLEQGINGEIQNFIYPLFLEAFDKYPQSPQTVITIFQNWATVLNLLWKNFLFSEMAEVRKENPIILIDGQLTATRELREVGYWKAGWCPLMRGRWIIRWTLMTDFILLCVKFWTYRKTLEISQD